MQDLTSRKSTLKNYLVVASSLFGLFFGAGNSIFLLHPGQLAGSYWGSTVVDFLITGALLPLLSVLTVAVTHAEGVFDIGHPLGAGFALVFMVLIHATIGSLFGTSRTATVSPIVGLAPFVDRQHQSLALLLLSALFFGAASLSSYRENDILANIGKTSNPVFSVLLFLVFAVGFAHPPGNPATAPTTSAYAHGALTNGFLEGYSTTDALAGLVFGVTAVTAVRSMGQRSAKDVSKVIAKAGVLSTGAVAFIYLLLILLDVMSLGRFKVSPDGGVAFNQLVNTYAGALGQIVLTFLLTVTCLTTAVDLVAAFAQDFHKHFSKASYHTWLTLSCLTSFPTANFGLDQIIAQSTPTLVFLYPLSVMLIPLPVTSLLFNRDGVVYFFVVLFIAVPAPGDMVVAFPMIVSQSSFGSSAVALRNNLSLANMGLFWLVPAFVDLVLGLLVHWYRHQRVTPTSMQSEVH